jgi:formyl-CoA transferase
MAPEQTYPLEGIRVVAIEQAIAIPLATRHLADLGAEVIKIEAPGSGDFARGYDSLANGLSVHFAWTSRGKKSVALDLKTPAGLARAQALIRSADVFVHNLGPGALERLGLGAEAVAALAPQVINLELSGYGATGPLAGRKAYDLLVQSEIGAAAVSGTPEEPTKIGISVVDISGAMYAVSAILAAIIERQRSGVGRAIKLSLFDTIAEWMSVPLLQAKYAGRFTRSGRFHTAIYPYGPFPCADGEITLAVQNDREWQRLCLGVLDDAALAADARYLTNEGRHQRRAVLGRMLDERLGAMAKAEVIGRLLAADVPFAESRTVEEAADHPHLRERDRWIAVDSASGPVSVLRSPYDTEGGWPTRQGRVPALDENGEDALT